MKYVLGIVIVAAMTAMVWFESRSYVAARAYEKNISQQVALMNVEDLTKMHVKAWMETLSFGLYHDKTKEKLAQMEKDATQTARRAYETMYWALAAAFAALVLAALVSMRVFVVTGSLVSVAMLVSGIVAPIMMMTIHKEVPYLGDVVLSFESKNVIGSIAALYAHGEKAVAVLIALFSVGIPVLKNIGLLFVGIFYRAPFAVAVVRFFAHLGKWSMADVFVVATFLVYIAGNNRTGRAEIEVGLYFFLAYVVVSMAVSFVADKMLHTSMSESK